MHRKFKSRRNVHISTCKRRCSIWLKINVTGLRKLSRKLLVTWETKATQTSSLVCVCVCVCLRYGQGSVQVLSRTTVIAVCATVESYIIVYWLTWWIRVLRLYLDDFRLLLRYLANCKWSAVHFTPNLIDSKMVHQRPVYQLHIIRCGTIIAFAL